MLSIGRRRLIPAKGREPQRPGRPPVGTGCSKEELRFGRDALAVEIQVRVRSGRRPGPYCVCPEVGPTGFRSQSHSTPSFFGVRITTTLLMTLTA